MTHFSLCTGIGGIDIAAEWAGFTTVGQCELADYPHAVLCKRWPDVPKWRDIRDVSANSVRDRGVGHITVLSAGFPCQPFSTAGQRRGALDDRHLWPEVSRVIDELQPTWFVGENVAGLISMALDDVLADLAAKGYETRAFVIPAAGVGAPHRRKRVFILGYAEHFRRPAPTQLRGDETTGNQRRTKEQASTGQPSRTSGPVNVQGVRGSSGTSEHGYVADADSPRQQQSQRFECQSRERTCNSSEDVADTKSISRRSRKESEQSARRASRESIGYSGGDVSYADHERLQIAGHQPGIKEILAENRAEFRDWWTTEPDVGRVANGIPSRVDRLKCLGNAVVPKQVYPIFEAISIIEKK